MASLVLALARRRGLQVVPNLPSVFCPLTTLSGWWVGSNGQLTAPLLLASISSLLSTRGSFSCLSQHFFSSLGLLLSSWLVDPTQTVQGIPNSPPLLHEKLRLPPFVLAIIDQLLFAGFPLCSLLPAFFPRYSQLHENDFLPFFWPDNHIWPQGSGVFNVFKCLIEPFPQAHGLGCGSGFVATWIKSITINHEEYCKVAFTFLSFRD